MNVSLRIRGASADKALVDHIRKRAALALGRFSPRIGSVLVRLEDLNGPKGGIDKRCSIELTGTFGQQLAEVRDQDFTTAVDRGFAVIQRSLTRLMKRRGPELSLVP
jgi:ribosome-associated translation inhibitor RaiA